MAEESGVPSLDLMEAAGTGIARELEKRWPPVPVLVLCGPGNNGGDGFVIARHLRASGWTVKVALLGSLEKLKGDAAVNAGRWEGPVAPLAPGILATDGENFGLVVDALFGAGLMRPLEGEVRELIDAVNGSGLPCVSVDMPSGVDGDNGLVLGGDDEDSPGAAVRAELTVTFFRKKPGHLLLPGRELCGEVVVVDIGIPDSVLDAIGPRQFENGPALWLSHFPWPQPGDHKYSRGHAVVVGGAVMTGAARLASRAALRAGAGLVTIASPGEALPIYATAMPGVLMSPLAGEEGGLAHLLEDARKNIYLIGPGNGVTAETRERVLAVLARERACVLDADAISVFQETPEDLFAAIKGPCVLTPHEGEFVRLFGEGTAEDGKLRRARAGARRSGAVVLLKGADTVIADAEGNAVINANAPPTLATAGAGDVLAGFLTGLMAQGMPPFEAAAAAAWLHGAAAGPFGLGLVAEDLPDLLPPVLSRLREGAGT